MNIKKQNVGVWVKASEELPDDDREIIITDTPDKCFETGEWHSFDFKVNVHKFNSKTDAKTHWLKPIEQVYVLTEDELEILCSMTRLFNNEETKQFLKSITK